MKWIQHILKEYNFLWVLYFLFIVASQLQGVLRSIVNMPHVPFYSFYDIILAGLYIFGTYAFVFRKKVFTPVIWQIIFLIIAFDLPFTIWRTFFADNPNNMQINCSQTIFPGFCEYAIFAYFLRLIILVLPVYYALTKLSFPKFKLPFSFVLYPKLSIHYIESPLRFWAVPVLGGLIKIIILIPYAIAQIVIGLCAFVLQLINAFSVLFTGKIWQPAFKFTLWALTMQIRAYSYLFGLTNNYPNFGEKNTDPLITFEYAMPEKSRRIYAIPILGILIRYLFIIPISTYTSYISFAALLGTIIGSFVVLFTGRYPKSVYELAKDSVRLNSSIALFFSGMSDRYPSFEISLNYPVKKALLISAVLLFILGSSLLPKRQTPYTPGSGGSNTMYEKIFKDSYINSCRNNNTAMNSYCTCTYDYLHKRYTAREMSQIGNNNVLSSQFSQSMQDAAKTCAPLLKHD